jgi:potassium channel subfamily K
MLLREEKERFEEMRKIQLKNEEWKRWVRLSITLSLFAVFWCVGAVGFWATEKETLGLTYWEALYFGWVTLITLGYGDISPHSWAGRCLFVIWVQFAVPAITILAQNMTSTVIATFNASAHGLTSAFLPRTETIHRWTIKHPWLLAHLPRFIKKKIQEIEAQYRLETGFPVGNEPSPNEEVREKKGEEFAAGAAIPDMTELVNQHEDDLAGKSPDAAALARQLALAIKRAGRDMALENPRQYTFEEWVEFTRLIRFSSVGGAAVALKEEDDEGLVEWDWLAENSPMMAQTTEAEFVLERLCESLVRYLRRNPPHSAFEESLREQGENALRLTNTVHHHDDDIEHETPAERRPSLISKIIGATKSLQPVKEEDHEHHNQSSRPGTAK